MKRSRLFALKQAIEVCSKIKSGKFQYALVKNAKKINKEIEDIDEVFKESEDFKENYSTPLTEIYKKYIKVVNEGGNEMYKFSKSPILADHPFELENSKDSKAFQKEISDLDVSSKKLLDERKKQIKERKDFIDENITFEFYMIKEESIPEDDENIGLIQLIPELIE